MGPYLTQIATFTAVLDIVLLLFVIPWILMTKKDATAAVAWCLVVILVPLVGTALFWMVGFTHVARPLKKVRRQKSTYRAAHPPTRHTAARGEEDIDPFPTWEGLGKVASRLQAFPVSTGNAVVAYHDTRAALAALIEEIRGATHHVHLEFFILRSDPTTDALVGVLTRRAREGIEVRLLYDAMGCVHLKRRTLRPLAQAGGRAVCFLPLNPWRSRVQVNLRNHRKLAVIDGRVGFTGGMNIGDEYLGRDPAFGYWRDSFLRLEGPALGGLQRIFSEDWAFSTGEALNGDSYFPALPAVGNAVVQVVESGPDQEAKTIREVVFAAIACARQRLWLASPYFIPDRGILDALRLACYRGVDVRLLTLLKPDHRLAHKAAQYYWGDLLDAGMAIYQYKRGMMHAKFMTADGSWALLGSANLDNRSLHLSFEAGVVLHSATEIQALERQFRRDLEESTRIDPDEFSRRPFLARLEENALRLLSPLL